MNQMVCQLETRRAEAQSRLRDCVQVLVPAAVNYHAEGARPVQAVFAAGIAELGVSRIAARGERKLVDLAQARQAMMATAYGLFDVSLPVVAGQFDRHHTTVMAAIRVVARAFGWPGDAQGFRFALRDFFDTAPAREEAVLLAALWQHACAFAATKHRVLPVRISAPHGFDGAAHLAREYAAGLLVHGLGLMPGDLSRMTAMKSYEALRAGEALAKACAGDDALHAEVMATAEMMAAPMAALIALDGGL